jgi:hypothetical protein
MRTRPASATRTGSAGTRRHRRSAAETPGCCAGSRGGAPREATNRLGRSEPDTQAPPYRQNGAAVRPASLGPRRGPRARLRPDASARARVRGAPAADEPQSSRPTLTSRPLCPADASVRRPRDLALGPRPERARVGAPSRRSLLAREAEVGCPPRECAFSRDPEARSRARHGEPESRAVRKTGDRFSGIRRVQPVYPPQVN